MNLKEKYSKIEDKLDEITFLEDPYQYIAILEEVYSFFQEVSLESENETLEEYLNENLHGSRYIMTLLLKDDILKYYLATRDENVLIYMLKFSNMMLNTFKITYLTREYIYVFATALYFLGLKEEAKSIIEVYIKKDNTFALGHRFIAEYYMLEGKEKESVRYLENKKEEILDLEEKEKIITTLIDMKKVLGKSISKEEKSLEKIYFDIKQEKRSIFWVPTYEDNIAFMDELDKCMDITKILKYLNTKDTNIEKKESALDLKLKENNIEYLTEYKNIQDKMNTYEKYKFSTIIDEAIYNIDEKALSIEKTGYTMKAIDYIVDSLIYVLKNNLFTTESKIDLANKELYKVKEILARNKITYEKKKEIIDKYKEIIKEKNIDNEIKCIFLREQIALANEKDEINYLYIKQELQKLKDSKNKTNSFYEIEFDYLFKFETANALLDTVENSNVIKTIKMLNKVLDMYMLMEKYKEINIIIYYATKYSYTIKNREERTEYIKNLFVYKKLLAKCISDFDNYKKFVKNETILFPYVAKINEALEYYDEDEILDNIDEEEIKTRINDCSYEQYISYLKEHEQNDRLINVLEKDIYTFEKNENILVKYNKEKVKEVYKKFLNINIPKTKYEEHFKHIIENKLAKLEL